MTNKKQIQTKKISFILALSVIIYTAIDTYLFLCHDINIMRITTPVILGLVIAIILCGLLHKFFYSDCLKDSHFKKKEIERQAEIMDAIREYVTVKTAPYLSKEDIATLISNIEYMAYDQPESYKPIRSNIDNPLRSPGLRHLAWNVGERLGIPLAKRAVFIKKSFPYELANATLEYLKLNLRDNVSSQIPIDVPDKGDYRFHLDADNDDSQ